MNSKDNKSSRELKREVIQELNQVNSDLDRIQGRLTPGQFIDDTLFHPVGRNPRAIFDHLAANPIGTAFLGLGTLLLMEDDTHVTYERQMKQKAASTIENTRYQATLLKGTVGNANERLHDRVAGYNEKIQGVSNKLHGVIDKTKGKVSELKGKIPHGHKDVSAGTTTGEYDLGAGGELGSSSVDEIKQNFTDAKENISGRVSEFTDRIDTLASGVKETAIQQADTVKNLDPMVWIAVGAGLGALTGAALPVSEKEQTLVDQKMSGKLNEFSSEFQDAINQSVRVLKDEFLGRFTDFDVSLFGRKSSASNETFRGETPQL